jgi:quercetin dioxygenase-like cupin family protein
MDQKNFNEILEQGVAFFPGSPAGTAGQPWHPHPVWKGVFLKDVVTGKATDGKFSYHLVRIETGCTVGNHDHETQWEWNMIVSGNGKFLIGNSDITIAPGQTYVAPPKIPHTVSAGDQGLLFLAIFVPALV